jgi:translation initiation factor 1 (eIF-1/SUI1)
MTDQDIINLRSADPFADVTGSSSMDSGASGATGQRSSNLIHIRIQQRSGKKTLTTVQVILFYFSLFIYDLCLGYW